MGEGACVFDIGHFRNTDGPGIRTILFFKGCPLRCLWCSNPFGLSYTPQLAVNRERCTACGACVTACPVGCNRVEDGVLSVDFAACTHCGLCVPPCPVTCRAIQGKMYTAEALVEEAAKDAKFYRKGGGGVTLSGGEPLSHAKVALEVLRRCRARLMNTCVETSAYVPFETLLEAAKLCHTLFIDLKHMDEAVHERITGVSSVLILDNIRRIADWAAGQSTCRLILRVPLIPGCNLDADNMERTAVFVASLAGEVEVNLLPYHTLGEGKYAMIGEDYALPPMKILEKSDEQVKASKATFLRHLPAHRVTVGGEAVGRNGTQG